MRRTAVRCLRIFILWITAPLVILVLPTFDLIARNREYFLSNYGIGSILYRGGLILLCVGLALLLAVERWPSIRVLAYAYFLAGPIWFVHLMVKNQTSFALYVLGLMWIGVSFWLTRMSDRDVRDRLALACGIVLIASLVPAMSTVPDAIRGRAPSGTSDDRLSMAGTDRQLPNVYHVILDEFQTEMFQEVLDKDLREELAGFLFFPEVTAVFGRTELSIASTFSGVDFNYRMSLPAFVRQAFDPTDSPLQAIRDEGYVITGQLFRRSIFGRTKFDRLSLHRDIDDGVLPGDEGLMASLWAYTNLPPAIAARVIPPDTYRHLEEGTLVPNVGPSKSTISFRRFILDEHQLSPTGRYTIIHVLLPHYPYVMSPTCQFSGATQSTSPSAQTRCTLRLVTEFLHELKALGRFDGSAIVIHGDHGAAFRRTPEGLQEAGNDDHFGETFSRSRSRPLLLFKPIGADASPLRERNTEGTLDDILPTLFDEIDLDYAFRGERFRLTSSSYPNGRTRYYHFYEKDRISPRRLIEGPLHRFRIEDDRVRFDRLIHLPRA